MLASVIAAFTLLVAAKQIPAQSVSPDQAGHGVRVEADNAQYQQLLDDLSKVGASLAKATAPGEIAACGLRQADVLGQLVAACPAEEQASWLRQMADCLQMAASNSPATDRTAYARLQRLQQQVAQAMPGGNVDAYVTFRLLEADYAAKVAAPDADVTRVQQEWREQLIAFVRSHPQAEDAPGAILELAGVSESLGRKADARTCYERLAQDFAGKPAGVRAVGALRWIDLQGQVLHLALPLLFTGNECQDVPFDIEDLRGKLVVVYFWSAAGERSRQDLAELTQVLEHYRGTGVEVLCVNMDNTPTLAREFLDHSGRPGTQVFQRGGLQGALALRYGLTSLPKFLLVGRDGKVLCQPAGTAEIGNELAQQLGPKERKAAEQQ